MVRNIINSESQTLKVAYDHFYFFNNFLIEILLEQLLLKPHSSLDCPPASEATEGLICKPSLKLIESTDPDYHATTAPPPKVKRMELKMGEIDADNMGKRKTTYCFTCQ